MREDLSQRRSGKFDGFNDFEDRIVGSFHGLTSLVTSSKMVSVVLVRCSGAFL